MFGQTSKAIVTGKMIACPLKKDKEIFIFSLAILTLLSLMTV